jgi:hypothetical protein
MENRDRDKVSRNWSSTEGGDVNRETSKNIGNQKDDSSSEFGQDIGRSEEWEKEPSGRTSGSVDESGMESSSGRTSSGSSDMGSESNRSNLGENISGSSEIEH